jgi:hypothetical protein
MNLGLSLSLGARRVVGVLIDPAVLFADGEVGGWYDPSDLATMSQTSDGPLGNVDVGDPVGRIEDKSGNGNHLTQATEGSRPTLQEDSNGKLHLLFASSFLSRTLMDFTSTDEVTVCAGVRKLSDAFAGSVAELGISGTNRFVMRAPNANAADGYSFAVGGTTIRGPTIVGLPAPTSNVVTGLSDISKQFAQLHVGNVIQNPGSSDQGAGKFSNAAFAIGARSDGSIFLNGRIYGIIVRGKLTSGTQLVRLKAYMAAQTGVTL